MNRQQIRELTDQMYPEVVRIRRHFHENAEVSEHETETCQYILDYLTAQNIECRRIAGNGVVATVYGSGSSDRTIGIRADIDALPITEKTGLPFASKRPGAMHACGHDMHAATLLGCAAALHQVREQLNGNVKFFFQPAEETIGGAEQMIKEGCLENPKVDISLALHMDEKYPVGQFTFRYGPMYASTTEFKIHVKGTSCHGAHPDMGADAIIMAGNLVSAFQTIISRNMDPTDPLVITIGTIHGGTAENIVTGEVTMTGTIRTLNHDHRDFAKKRMTEIADSITAAYGGSCEIEFFDSYPPLVNDQHITDTMVALAAEEFGPDSVILRDRASMGADDFAYFCQAVPSTYWTVGAAVEKEEDRKPLHNEYLILEEEAMRNGLYLELAGIFALL